MVDQNPAVGEDIVLANRLVLGIPVGVQVMYFFDGGRYHFEFNDMDGEHVTSDYFLSDEIPEMKRRARDAISQVYGFAHTQISTMHEIEASGHGRI